MKKQTRTIIIVLLNVLFCAYLLWFSANNAYLRPYAGSMTREFLAGLSRSPSPSSPSTLTRFPDRSPSTSSPPRGRRP